jgi:hypothetical protein
MAQCVNFDVDGFLKSQAQSVDECTGYILVSPTEYSLAVQSIEIDPVEILAVFSTVFGWVVFLSFLSYKVKIAKSTIRLA